MPDGGEFPQWLEKGRREEQDEEALCQREFFAPGAEIQKTEQVETDINGGHGNTDRSKKLQHGGGEEGDPQNGHRPLLEVLRIGIEARRRQVNGLERADRFQPAQAIEQEGIHVARLGQLLFTGGLGLPADQGHEERDGGHGE